MIFGLLHVKELMTSFDEVLDIFATQVFNDLHTPKPFTLGNQVLQ